MRFVLFPSKFWCAQKYVYDAHLCRRVRSRVGLYSKPHRGNALDMLVLTTKCSNPRTSGFARGVLKHSIGDKSSRFYVQLSNAFLGFLALVDFPFEFRCWMWGNYPPIVTADACVKIANNFMTKNLADASRPATSIDCDMKTLCLKLSMVSGVFFVQRVQFILGALEATGSSPAWLSPANRRSERVPKTERSVAKKRSREFQPGERGKLVAALVANGAGGGINQVEHMNMDALKSLHKGVFGSGTSR